MVKKSNKSFEFVWRVTVAHVIAYFIAGIITMSLFDYETLFSTGILSCIMKPTTDPIVALGGTSLQLIRGIIIALILSPLRTVFTEEKRGFLKLGLLIFGLSVLSTFGPTFGSIEGMIFTKMSFIEQISGYPEALIWISLFIGILYSLYRFEKKLINIIAITFTVLIVLMGIAGYFQALQM